VVLIVTFIGGCVKKQSDQPMKAANGGKKYGGRYTLNEIRGNPASMDPVRMNSKLEDDIASNIFDKLIDNNEKLEVVPELATRWEISPDGKTYTFHLRNDVVFHDDACFPNNKGRKMVASDVKYSFQRVCDPKTLTSGSWVFQDIVEGVNEYFHREGDEVKEVTGFIVQDDSTFIVKLTKPYAPFLQHLTTSFGYVIPHEAVEKYGKDFFRHPIGTGPFHFDHWAEDQEILLKRNPNYWQYDDKGNKLPLLDEVRFTFIKDDKTLWANFEQGSVDEDFTIPTEMFPNVVTADKKLAPQYDKKYVLQHVTAMNSYFFDFLTTDKLFSNTALRRALSFAVDRAQICKYVLKNAPHGPAHNGIVPPAFSRYPIDQVHGISFNADSAKYWLEKAGYKNGSDVPTITISVYNEPRPMQIVEAVQSMWKQNLGINVNIQVMQASQLLDASEDGKLQLWLTRWYADYPEVENFLNLMNGALVPKDASAKSYPNSTRWKNDQFVQIFNQAIATTDESERMKLYAQAENIAVAEAPSIPLFYEEHYRLLQPYVKDNPLDPMNRIDLKYVWLDK